MHQNVRIEKLVYGGDGIARTDAGVVFVPGVIPGELVEVVAEQRKNGIVRCTVERIIEQSKRRRRPFCPHFGECGGCDWQFIDYQYQPEIKRDILIDCMVRIGKIGSELKPEIFCCDERGYRIRSQIKIDRSANTAGFFKKKSNSIVAITTCPLLSDPLNTLLADFSSGKVELPHATVLRVIEGANAQITSSPVISNRTLPQTEIRVENRRFIIQGESFFQSNGYLLQQLGRWAAKEIKADRCMDLYGGCGFFSVMLHDCYNKGMLVENSFVQTELAKKNCALNGIGNVDVVCGDVEKAKAAKKVRDFKPDCVIVDPPRPGLTRCAREWISSLSPSTLLYVSCNPSTLARDTNFFVNRCGYRIKRSALFDLYPNTTHLEAAIVLVK